MIHYDDLDGVQRSVHVLKRDQFINVFLFPVFDEKSSVVKKKK